MPAATGVMRLQTGIKVFGKAGVESFGIGQKNINIIKRHYYWPAFAYSFGAADFASSSIAVKHQWPAETKLPGSSTGSEVWWRRRESNPRPETFRQNIYIFSLCFEFRFKGLPRQDSSKASLWSFASLL